MPGIDLSNASRSGAKIINSVISLLPNLPIALIIFCVFLVVAGVVRSIVRLSPQQIAVSQHTLFEEVRGSTSTGCVDM